MMELDRSPLRYRIIGALIDVHRELGPGYLEKSYQEAVELAFEDRAIPFQREAPIPIWFQGRKLRTIYLADFVCDGKILVELKAQRSVGNVEAAQVIHYLKGSGLPVGLLANFGEEELYVRRYVGAAYEVHSAL